MRLRARPPAGTPGHDLICTDADLLASVREDAAHFPGGIAAGVAMPRSEADVAAILRASRSVLPIGAQSSLTGGATPHGDVVIRTNRLNRILEIMRGHVRVEPGVTLADLETALAAHGLAYPPTPTFTGACVGGIVATNAAGPATFKYGTTREWVEALTVVLADGSVLDIERGQVRAEGGRLEIVGVDGAVRVVPLPTYRMPPVRKQSAGYASAPDLDAIDLFIGSEGTLGVITTVTLRVLPNPPARCFALVPCRSEQEALALVAALRDEAHRTWTSSDPKGIDVSAIEQMDRRSVALLREDGADARFGVPLPDWVDTLLLVHLDLDPGTTGDAAYAELAAALEPGSDGRLVRFCRLLESHGVLDDAQVAAPGDTARVNQLLGIREAVPAAVNHRVGIAQRSIDPRITKTAADMVVPFERFGEMMALYRARLEARGLDYAIWGHGSDGNVHPNVIPRSYADVEAGREVILEWGRDVVGRGGCPLAEHGVGRNTTKQALLRQLYGEKGIEEMRAVKCALDPEWKLAPGVLFPAR
ncbi:MAG TPA: FAD-binding oxidoreductase [Vicinamibacterales bacterium]|nr:FAD-binding oxidoreductase [Vicinamibacterales bacterium]